MAVLNCIDLELWEYNQFGDRRLRDDLVTPQEQHLFWVALTDRHVHGSNAGSLDWGEELESKFEEE